MIDTKGIISDKLFDHFLGLIMKLPLVKIPFVLLYPSRDKRNFKLGFVQKWDTPFFCIRCEYLFPYPERCLFEVWLFCCFG